MTSLFRQSFFGLPARLSSPTWQNTSSARPYLSHTPLFTPPPTPTQWRWPVFHLAARWAVWMCLAGYITPFLQLLPPARRHCITSYCAPASQGSFFSAFSSHKHDPPTDGAAAKPSAESDAAPLTGGSVPPCSWMTRYVTSEGQSSFPWVQLCFILLSLFFSRCHRNIRWMCSDTLWWLHVAVVQHLAHCSMLHARSP